jgi:hypothetical protein
LAIAAYIAIGFVTKKLLTWNLALLYFVVVLEFLPRLVRRVFRRSAPEVVES